MQYTFETKIATYPDARSRQEPAYSQIWYIYNKIKYSLSIRHKSPFIIDEGFNTLEILHSFIRKNTLLRMTTQYRREIKIQ